MTDNMPTTPIAIAWTGVIAVFTLGQFNAILGTLCAISSLVATVYAIRVSQATLRLREKKLRERRQAAELEKEDHGNL